LYPFIRYLNLDCLYLKIFGGFIPNYDQYFFDTIDYCTNRFFDHTLSGDVRLYGMRIRRRLGIIEDFWYPDTRFVIKQPLVCLNVVSSRSITVTRPLQLVQIFLKLTSIELIMNRI
jgi:hypothetical protein